MLKNETLFNNFSDEDFEWKHDGKLYTFKAGSITPMEEYEHFHFTKHLVDREMIKADIRTNDQTKRAEFEAKCKVKSEEKQEAPEQEAPEPASTKEVKQEQPKSKVKEDKFEGK